MTVRLKLNLDNPVNQGNQIHLRLDKLRQLKITQQTRRHQTLHILARHRNQLLNPLDNKNLVLNKKLPPHHGVVILCSCRLS